MKTGEVVTGVGDAGDQANEGGASPKPRRRLGRGLGLGARALRPTLGLLACVCAASACGVAPISRAPSSAMRVAPPRAVAAPAFLARVGSHREGATVSLGAAVAETSTANAGANASANANASEGRSLVYVADEDENLLRVIDAKTQEELGATPLDGRPGQLLVLADGSIAVALRDRARVDVMVPSAGLREPFRARSQIAVAAEPVALALAPDDSTLFVASAWGRSVAFVDTSTMAVRERVALGAEARAISVAADGRHAYVSHVTGGDTVSELKGRVAGQTYALVKGQGLTEGRLFLPQTLTFSGDPLVQSSGYGGDSSRLSAQVFNVAIVDETNGKVLAKSIVLPADADQDFVAQNTGTAAAKRRCLLPRGAAALGRELFVTCLGIDAVVAYDGASTRPRQAERRRFAVPEGPTGIAIDAATSRAYVWSQFARALSVVDLKSESAEGGNVQSAALPRHRQAVADDEVVALGRRLFHGAGDERLSGDGRACASCHPDGRDDGLVWSTPNGPRQTPMLAGRTAGTAPFSWLGDAKTVSDHLEHTLSRLSGKGLPKEDREALSKYLAVMSPPPSPAAGPNDNDELRARGAAIFASAETGCASCHGAKGDDPDGLPHDVGSRAAGDKGKVFDTPSLRYLGGSAPYFHDGRYADLRTMLKKTNGQMGQTAHLASRDLDALEAFLRSL